MCRIICVLMEKETVTMIKGAVEYLSVVRTTVQAKQVGGGTVKMTDAHAGARLNIRVLRQRGTASLTLIVRMLVGQNVVTIFA